MAAMAEARTAGFEDTAVVPYLKRAVQGMKDGKTKAEQKPAYDAFKAALDFVNTTDTILSVGAVQLQNACMEPEYGVFI